MNLSAQSNYIIAHNLDLLRKTWEVLNILQNNPSFSSISEHSLESKNELYVVYHEYLWLLERLKHPKEISFFKTSYIPINGYLDGYFEFSEGDVRFFKAEYLPSEIGEMNWSVIPLATNRREVNEILKPECNLKDWIGKSYNQSFNDGIVLMVESLIEKISNNDIADPVIMEDILIEPCQRVSFRNDLIGGVEISGVTGLAHHLLPELEHEVIVTEYWCEHFDDLYLFELDEEIVRSLVSNLNQFSMLNQFLGNASEKRYRLKWVVKNMGQATINYFNNNLTLSTDSKELTDLVEKQLKTKGIK